MQPLKPSFSLLMTAIRGADNARAASAAGPLGYDQACTPSVLCSQYVLSRNVKLCGDADYAGYVKTENGLISHHKWAIHRLSTMFAQDFRQ
jgi:hypothetical protein